MSEPDKTEPKIPEDSRETSVHEPAAQDADQDQDATTAGTDTEKEKEKEKEDKDSPPPPVFKKGPRFWAIIFVLSLISLLTSLEATITSTVMPSLVAELDGGENFIWVSNAYFLTM